MNASGLLHGPPIFSHALAATSLPSSPDVDRAAAAAIGSRLVASLRTPIVTEREHHVGVSVGVCLIPHDGIASEEGLAYADAAMYQAKAEGGSEVGFFKPGARLYRQTGRVSRH